MTTRDTYHTKILVVVGLLPFFLFSDHTFADDVSHPFSHEVLAEKDYSHVTLNILTHEIPVMGEPTQLHAKQFEDLTCATVVVHHVPFARLYQELMLGLKKGKYDIVLYGSLWIADVQQYLEPVPSLMKNSIPFQDVLPIYQSTAQWGGTFYQVPIDGDRHYLQHRTDLLTDPKFKREFFTQTGKPLSIPETWPELQEIARFFHGRTLANGTTISGLVEITRKEDLLFSQFIKRAAPYAKHPDVGGGFYFDLATMKPLINTPGFVAALQDFVDAQDLYPESSTNFGLADVISSFGSGQAVFSDSWDDSFIQAMEPESSIRNMVGASLSPGSRRVWNRRTGQWDAFPGVNRVPYVAWGWTSAVAKSSPFHEAAFAYLGFFANEKNHASDLLVGRFGVNPFRKSDLDKHFWIEGAGWDPKVARSYVKTLELMNSSPNRIMDLRIHLGRQYMNALAIGVYRALSHRDTPQDALDTVAEKWKQLNQRVGVDKQREAYSEIVLFEDGN